MAEHGEIAQFTTVFRASHPRSAKRHRQTVSCTACQRRKSKCDRQHPWGACEKRRGPDVCRYESPADRAAAGSRREVKLRLGRLEQMVRGFAENGFTRTMAPLEDGDGDGQGDGRSTVTAVEERPLNNGTEARYHGATSWTALMESIHGIQNILAADADGEPETPDDELDTAEPDVVMGQVPPLTIEDVVDGLPPRQVSDRLISAYFNAKFLSVPFIHVHHFRRRYDAFWDSPSSTSFLWISILFSILSVGAMVAQTKSSNNTCAADSKAYMTKSAQCLIAGQYQRAEAFSVEALLMHVHARNTQKQDSDSTLWALYGLTVRLAQRRGYHRDAAKMSGCLTPFEAEMRRRTWFLIQSTDLLFSFQNGMPSVITEDACDVHHPTNLTDDDFDEDSVSLPAPRPATDPIPILVCIVKSSICRVMRRIMRHALAVTPTPYAETLARDRELREWHAAVPACLRIRRIRDTAFTDPNYTVMHRLMLELVYLKCLCILHRPYLTSNHDDDDARYAASRQIRRHSALSILELQAELDQETNPGGRMYEDRFMVSSMTLHHFLVAAMVVCLDLSESRDISLEDRAKRVSMLHTAYQIWSSRSVCSSDASYASKVLRAILNKVEPSALISDTPSTGVGSSETSSTKSIQQQQQHRVLDSSQTVEMPAYGGGHAAAAAAALDAGYTINSDETPTLDDFFSNTEMLDWYSIDQYLQLTPSSEGSWKQVFSDIGSL